MKSLQNCQLEVVLKKAKRDLIIMLTNYDIFNDNLEKNLLKLLERMYLEGILHGSNLGHVL